MASTKRTQDMEEDLEELNEVKLEEESQDESSSAQIRILTMYSKLIEGKSFSRDEMADEFGVSVRTIQRDINTIKNFVSNSTNEGHVEQVVRYSSHNEGYVLEPPMRSMLQESECFTLLKILMECRGLNKKELGILKDEIVACCIPQNQRTGFLNKINTEWTNYVEPRHGKDLIKAVWGLEEAVRERTVIKITYRRNDGKEVERLVMPVGIIFNEYYFYMLAYIKSKQEDCKDDIDKIPTVYRIDRIVAYKKKKDKFKIPYEKQFPEGEFRKRVQFMFTGPLHIIKFYCKNSALEAALDRLPTAEIIEKGEERSLVRVEVYGEGINMWFKSQGDAIEVVKDTVLGQGKL
ncbi:MAG: WYL domain-containing protein [Phascolarctobacterium sp.]|nr:WYL domain-containing protein [Phascolarctobacterium sp.]